jgi:hypothetical protein
MRVSFLGCKLPGCTLLLLLAVGTGFGQDTNFATGPQYLMNYGSPFFAHSISTPSLSWASPALDVGATNATEGLIAGAENQSASQPQSLPPVNLFPIYYGGPPASVVEISFGEEPGGASPAERLPESILDTGVWQMTTAEALRERGYGLPFVEAAAYGKAHTGHATRVYTNADIDRLHSGS